MLTFGTSLDQFIRHQTSLRSTKICIYVFCIVQLTNQGSDLNYMGIDGNRKIDDKWNEDMKYEGRNKAKKIGVSI